MRGISARASLLMSFALCVLLPAMAFGQTGKVVGQVVEKGTNQPIIGANVVIEGTSRGASTDLDGNFFILAVQAGTYTVRASALGYATTAVSDVQVNIDRTTTLEFQLESSAVRLEEVTVVYKKPVVELDVSSKVERISSESLSLMAQDDVTAALMATPGFKIDDEGKIHIRGGRDTEARFLVDGIDTRDPITGESLPLNLSSINIQEIQILTGGMSSEYGQAMSGFVTISTPEGAPDTYNGTITWETDQFTDRYSFNQDMVNAALGGPVPFTNTLFDRPLTFYATFNGNISDTHTSLGVEYDPSDYIGAGVSLPRRQYNDWGGSLKLAYDLGRGKKLSAYFTERTLTWDVYGRGTADVSGNYGWQYAHNLGNLPIARDKRSSFSIDFTSQASRNTVMTMSVGRRVINASVEPRGKKPGEFTLEQAVEHFAGLGIDANRNGRLDQDADGDGVVQSGIVELANDTDQNTFLDGFFDANNNGIWDGENEGYEDLNMNGRWDRGEDWIDLNGNGVYDYAEPWTDRADPVTGQNNIGVWDPWDPFIDLNGNGVWDPAEPQLPEQDLNGNGRWDGERYQDANGNGVFDRYEPFTDLNGNYKWDPGEPFVDYNGNGVQDDGEGYDDWNLNGRMDYRDLVNNTTAEDEDEPFWDGDLWYDTGEPFVDLPDPLTGHYNGYWDLNEPFWDLPSSNSQIAFSSGALIIGGGQILGVPTLNGQYDPPNGNFDEYELFTFWTGNPQEPVGYTWDRAQHGAEWIYTNYLEYIPTKSTWINRTLHDEDNPVFNPPNNSYDAGQERFIDYNGDGVWNGRDLFLNPGVWDQSAVWSKRRTEEYSFKFKFQSQIHKFHELKAGTEFYYYIMSQQYIEAPDQLYTGSASVGSNEPWADRGAVRDFWEYRPIEGAAYLEDKMEFEGLIIQAGLRSDFTIHDQNVVDEQRRRYEAGEPGAVLADKFRIQFAPRLGISHPITERSKMYFNYGHFYQRPSFTYFYKSTTTNVDEGTVGNPNLKYERTVTYEVGVHNQITDDISVQIAGYYRDLYNLISTVSQREGAIVIYRYINLDYGRMRGFEMKVDKAFANHWQMNVNYDFSYAYGKASGALDTFNRRATNVPVNYDEHPLDWDETHRVTVNTAVMYQKGDYPVLFGLRFPDNWLMSIQWQFGSGRPYTPSEFSTGINPNLILENSARMPWTETTNVRFEKYFGMGQRPNGREAIRWILGLQIYNLFDKDNVNAVYTSTGTTDIAVHPLDRNYNPFLDRSAYDANPRNYGPGRQILAKVGIEF